MKLARLISLFLQLLQEISEHFTKVRQQQPNDLFLHCWVNAGLLDLTVQVIKLIRGCIREAAEQIL